MGFKNEHENRRDICSVILVYFLVQYKYYVVPERPE
jgi:hypothetical protein